MFHFQKQTHNVSHKLFLFESAMVQGSLNSYDFHISSLTKSGKKPRKAVGYNLTASVGF